MSAKLRCHGCDKSGQLFLHVMEEKFIYALCQKCVDIQLDVEYYMKKNGDL